MKIPSPSAMSGRRPSGGVRLCKAALGTPSPFAASSNAGHAAGRAPADSPSEVVKWNARSRMRRRSPGTISATSSSGESGAACPSCRRGRRGRRRDPRASGVRRPRRAALETFRHGNLRTPTGGHQAALSVVLFCAELASDSFPSRAKRSDNEAAGWLSPKLIRSRSAAQSARILTAYLKEAFLLISRAGSRRSNECAPPRQKVQEPISLNCDGCFSAHA